jgi:hypothetical protein
MSAAIYGPGIEVIGRVTPEELASATAATMPSKESFGG